MSDLIPMREWLESHHKAKRAFKNDKERKRYITQELGMSVQKDPSRDGMLCVPVASKSVMLSGLRMSAKRVKEEVCDDKATAKESFRQASASISEKVKSNTKDC